MLACVVVVLATGWLLVRSEPAPPAPAPARGPAAAEIGVVPDLTWGTPRAEQDRTAATLKAVGSRWVRLSIEWARAEPVRGRYDKHAMRHYDRAIARAQASGQRIVIMVYTTPEWASGSGNENTPPRHPAAYARFVEFLAHRWAGEGLEAYEIWNEPNIARFWAPRPSPRGYGALLKAAYPAVKRADPRAKVVFGGLSTNDYGFLERVYASGAGGSFDVMAVHPYTCRERPGKIDRSVTGRIQPSSFAGYREVRASMLGHGQDKPIWLTEFGWTTSSGECGVSESTQASYIEGAVKVLALDPYVQVALWYNLRNNYWLRDADDYEARFGLLRTDFTRKPAFAAFKRLATARRALGRSAAVRPTPPTGSPAPTARVRG